MPTEIVAVIISVVSVGVAMFALGWNVYRDVILKGRVRISVAVGDHQVAGLGTVPFIIVTATNFGPGSVQVDGFAIHDSSRWRRFRDESPIWVVKPLFEHPLCSSLPRVLAAGDRLHLVFPYDQSSFLSDRYARLALIDTFGRAHSAPERQHKLARRRYEQDFGAG